jgi:hypothetical protein
MFKPIWGSKKRMNYWPFIILNGLTLVLILDAIMIVLYLLLPMSKHYNTSPIPWLFLVLINIITFVIDAFQSHHYWIKNFKESNNQSIN